MKDNNVTYEYMKINASTLFQNGFCCNLMQRWLLSPELLIFTSNGLTGPLLRVGCLHQNNFEREDDSKHC